MGNLFILSCHVSLDYALLISHMGILPLIFYLELIGDIFLPTGILELFFLPLVVQPEKQRLIHLGKDNCYGAGFFAGVFVS